MVATLVSDWGPLFYFANRVGKDNKRFKMWKFRSMRVARGANEASLRPDRNRIYWWGKWMRRLKIDELPQLINILNGTMSIVGPRPAAVDQVEITRGGENAAVAKIKPGLTGPSALYDYMYGDLIEDEDEYMEKVAPTRLALDRYYLNHQSITYDAKMIWYTVLCILNSAKGTVDKKMLEELIDSVHGDRRALEEV
jgi:O-antigen biosynthesis protein WbqP